MNNIPENIFDLFQKKSFEMLTESDQQQVLACMDKDDYNDLYEACQFEKENLNANPLQIKSHKNEMWNELQAKPILSFWKSKLPWQIASSILLPLCLFFAFQNKTKTIATEIVHQKTDTLYIEKPAITKIVSDTFTQWKEKIVYQTKYVKMKNEKIKLSEKPIVEKNKWMKIDRKILSSYMEDSEIVAVLPKPHVTYNNQLEVAELTKAIGFNEAEKERNGDMNSH